MTLIDAKKKLLMAQKGGVDVSELFNTSLWTGTGAARTITTGIDSGEESLVWSKSRSVGNGHILVDTVRGAGNYLSTNVTTQQTNSAQSISAFSSAGYSLGNFGSVNASGTTQVGWQFRRAEKFFDIVHYTGNGVAGRAIAHSLGVKPGMMIFKRADSASQWGVYHESRGASQKGYLNLTPSFGATVEWFNSEPTEGVFFIGDQNEVNANGGTYIAYLFAHDPSPEGLIQCGSYVGNSSTTGPVVNLGWRPQYLMIKNATAVGDWQIIDAQRGFTAANDAILLANTSGAETSANLVNPNSTGFQLSSTASNVNTTGQTYIYMAIREAA